MASNLPPDIQRGLVHPLQASVVNREQRNVGQWTANNTVSSLVFIADRALVVREVWIACDAIPADADGTMLVTVKARDVSEGAFDTLVNAFNAESVVLVANKGYQATLATETTENEWTLAAGDAITVDLVSDSAAINTNANVLVSILWQPLELL